MVQKFTQIFQNNSNLLFRDVAAGKFGDNAKTGEWYTAIKEVKDTYPKP